jgi:hypothetical protein
MGEVQRLAVKVAMGGKKRQEEIGWGPHTHMLDASPQHHLVEDLATRLSNEPICRQSVTVLLRVRTRCHSSFQVSWLAAEEVGQGASYDSSIAGPRESRGWTWLRSRSAVLNPGLGVSRTAL